MSQNIIFCSYSEELLPYKATAGSICRDLKLSHDCDVSVGKAILAPTGVKVALPQGRGIKIYARSSLPVKYGVFVANSVGIIDSDYRGELKVELSALGEDKTLPSGTKIAQLEIFHYFDFNQNNYDMKDIPELKYIVDQSLYENFSDTFPTNRGEGSFGSTGA